MQIKPVAIQKFDKLKPYNTDNKLNLKNFLQNKHFTKIPNDCYKANFLPFAGLKTVGEAYVIDRKTGEKVKAAIKKDEIKDEYCLYKLYKDKKELGAMDMSPYSRIPNTIGGKPVNAGKYHKMVIPKIEHIRTIEGDKYSRIGSTLVNLAIEESKKYGFGGGLWLFSEKGFQKMLSLYRSNKNPIPFYYKLGFRALGEEDEKIKEYINNYEYAKLPNSAILVLDSETVKKGNKYLEPDFVLN